MGCGGGETDDDRLDAAVDSLPENRLDVVVCSDPFDPKLEQLPCMLIPLFESLYPVEAHGFSRNLRTKWSIRSDGSLFNNRLPAIYDI